MLWQITGVSSIFKAEKYNTTYIYSTYIIYIYIYICHKFFICSSVDAHLGYLFILAIINAAVNKSTVISLKSIFQFL